jgi:hypothetical protein
VVKGAGAGTAGSIATLEKSPADRPPSLAADRGEP